MAIAGFHLEGYGCSMNRADTEAIRGFLCANGLAQAPLSKADCIIINTCAVKEQTEKNMLNRIISLNRTAEKNDSQLIVFGCLPKTSRHKIEEISKSIICIGPDLKKLSQVLSIESLSFSPSIKMARKNPFVAIMPINSGCTSSCTFCATRFARGKVKSHSIKELKKSFVSLLPKTKEL